MPIRDHLPATLAVFRPLTGRIARRVYATLLLTLLITTTAIRVHTYLLTRKFQAVLQGLSKIQIDQTTEAEIPRLVPYLTRNPREIPVGPIPLEAPNVDAGTEHFYTFEISNNDHWMRFGTLAEKFSRVNYSRNPTHPPESWIYSFANWLGYRYIRLRATVLTLNGTVSSIHYEVANTFGFPRQLGNIVSVSGIHGWWAPYMQLRIDPITDENPQFVVFGDEDAIQTKFTPDAPPSRRGDIFKINLRCLWNFTTCHPVQMTPALWSDKRETEQRAFARLTSDNPCPNSLVASRLKYIPDLDLLLLESTGLPKTNPSGYYLDPASQLHSHYKLVEAIRGYSEFWKSSIARSYIPDPRDSYNTIPNKNSEWRPAGQRVLLFLGPTFESCHLVSATPAALDAARNTHPASKRDEDQIASGLM